MMVCKFFVWDSTHINYKNNNLQSAITEHIKTDNTEKGDALCHLMKREFNQ